MIIKTLLILQKRNMKLKTQNREKIHKTQKKGKLISQNIGGKYRLKLTSILKNGDHTQTQNYV